MTYAGATAASSLTNAPMRISGGMGGVSEISTGTGGGRQIWLYNSSNGTSDIAAANFFTDAFYLGMKEGDIVMGAVCSGSSKAFFAGVLSSVTTNGAALASSGAFISSTR